MILDDKKDNAVNDMVKILILDGSKGKQIRATL